MTFFYLLMGAFVAALVFFSAKDPERQIKRYGWDGVVFGSLFIGLVWPVTVAIVLGCFVANFGKAIWRECIE